MHQNEIGQKLENIQYWCINLNFLFGLRKSWNFVCGNPRNLGFGRSVISSMKWHASDELMHTQTAKGRQGGIVAVSSCG